MKWELNKNKYLTQAEIDKLFSTVRQLEQEEQSEFRSYWKRCHMVLDLIFSTGIRVSECKNLRHKDFDLLSELPSLSVVGKRKKLRYIPISEVLKDHIFTYVLWKESQGYDVSGSGYFFESPKGSCYSVSGLEQMYLRALKIAGIPRRTFHSSRHSLGVKLYNHPATKHSLKTIQQIFGHASCSTSAIYAIIPWDQLCKSINEVERR